MNEDEKKEILKKAEEFFRDVIAKNHYNNTKLASELSKYNINPFTTNYLAYFLTGNNNPESLAKAIVYPRVLGTSINTTFGHHLQSFCSNTLQGLGSTTSGIDIEFIDQVDQRRKYCQLKAGPNTINKDDTKTIRDHFLGVKNLARTNNLNIRLDDLVIGVFYGDEASLSTHYRKLSDEYPVFVGIEFWQRLTGDRNFYQELIDTITNIAGEFNGASLVNDVVEKLAIEISQRDSL
jgi:hypothetical protein